jgi:hypothetical protein
VGTLTGVDEYHHRSVRLLEAICGPVLRETLPAPWEHTDYYAEELGPGLMRRFIFFERLIGQDELGDIKLKTMAIESELSERGKRTVNIDPGYLTEAKVVLASTKDYSHRICLGNGIYAEVTLYCQHGRFRDHLFTYMDYKEEKNIRLFGEMREILGKRLRRTKES